MCPVTLSLPLSAVCTAVCTAGASVATRCTSAAAQLHNVYEHGTLVMIAKDLAYIAMSDGEVAKQEELFWADCLKAMGVTPADIKDSNDE